MSSLADLQELRAAGLMPADRIIWIGLGFVPPKQNAIGVGFDQMPTAAQCLGVVGLDVILIYKGHVTKYGAVRNLSNAIYQAKPRRLQLIDLDFHRVAFLKLVGA